MVGVDSGIVLPELAGCSCSRRMVMIRDPVTTSSCQFLAYDRKQKYCVRDTGC